MMTVCCGGPKTPKGGGVYSQIRISIKMKNDGKKDLKEMVMMAIEKSDDPSLGRECVKVGVGGSCRSLVVGGHEMVLGWDRIGWGMDGDDEI